MRGDIDAAIRLFQDGLAGGIKPAFEAGGSGEVINLLGREDGRKVKKAALPGGATKTDGQVEPGASQ